jgi:phage/plasmid-associated DNA primase
MTNQNDSNSHLLCFNNGVVDFCEKVMRSKRDEDNLTKSTNVNYIPLDRKRDADAIAEIDEFMAQLFPTLSQRDYMWEHLASILIGNDLCRKLQMYMYIGSGCNGKTTLTSLLSQCLGDYCTIIPASLITEASSDYIALSGIRLALIQEVSMSETINSSALTKLTSGKSIVCRDLLGEPVTFIPQCKIILTSNALMNVDNDVNVWSKIAVIDFKTLFTNKPKDGNVDLPHQCKQDMRLHKKFPKWREVFMAMLVERAFVLKG